MSESVPLSTFVTLEVTLSSMRCWYTCNLLCSPMVGNLSRERRLDDWRPIELLRAELCDLCYWKSSEFRLFCKPTGTFRLDFLIWLLFPTAAGRSVPPVPPLEVGALMAVLLV